MGWHSVTGVAALPLRIYLVRHGETEWSLSGQYTGSTDIPLTAKGEAAARKLGLRLRSIPFTRVLTSPLQRAQQTCVLAGVSPVAEIEPDLGEWGYGDYEGRTPADIYESSPDWNLFRDGAPHGETPEEVSVRVDRFIVRLRLLEGNVALFSHGHIGRVIVARWIDLSIRQAQGFLLNTASLSILCYEHNRIGHPAIALLNAASDEVF